MLPSDYDACFRKNIETGFCTEGTPCGGEYDNSNSSLYKRCLHCPYLNNKVFFREVEK